jgi:type IV pilus assembly protein PilP
MKARSLLFSLACIGALSGCGGGEHEDIKQWMAEASRDLKGRVPPLPELKPFPVVSYEAADHSDPFSAGRMEADKQDGADANKPDFDRPREALEAFPLESLQFIGVVSKNKGRDRLALIRVNGAVYQAAKGNYLGQNFGRITAIHDTEIVLMETVQDPSGQTAAWVEQKMTLQLLEGPQGKESGK